jgi:SSS family solute:Na+ symporter
MTYSFAPLDYLVLAAFGLVVSGIILWAKTKRPSLLQFLTMGRGLTLPAFVATLVSTWYGGILGIGESVSYYGIGTWLLMGVPFYAFGILYAFWLAKRVRESEQISIPERISARFGRGAAIISAGLVFLLAVPAAHVLMLGTLAQVVTGWPLAWCVAGAGLVAVAALYRGGMLADVRLGFVAFGLMYLGFVVIDGWCLWHFPVRDAIASLPPGLRSLDGGQGPLAVGSYFILGAWTLVDPGFHQRVASAQTPQTGRNGVLLSVVCWVLFDFLSITAGIYALHVLKPLPTDPVQIFPALGSVILPPGLRGLFFVGMAGTILSALVGYTLVSGATIGREMIGRGRPGQSDEAIANWTRVGFGVSTIVAVLLAQFVQSVVGLWYAWSGAVVGALLIPFALAYAQPKRDVASRYVSVAMVASFLTSFCWLVYGKRTHNDLLEVVVLEQKFSLGTLVPGLGVSALIIGYGWAVAGKSRT